MTDAVKHHTSKKSTTTTNGSYTSQNLRRCGGSLNIDKISILYSSVRGEGENEVLPCKDTIGIRTPQWLCRDAALQVVKAMKVMNEYRMISDVPVDGAKLLVIDATGHVDWWSDNARKLQSAIFGVVKNDGSEHEPEPWREKVRIANKILQFAWHGIVEERL